ncbi:unnamed protein product [Nezara viridula]|uniref:Neuropeptide n=1 Tax=Nezara viridula TaxID=85310 RepID=A0A9P0HH57_NEZVI|nr:unnamed protein product [Nezara viridula]
MKYLILLALLVVFYFSLISSAPQEELSEENNRKRYLFYPTATTNLTGWTYTTVPLGLALFGSNPYIIG